MKFKANTRRRAIEYEKDLVQQWKKNRTFEESVEMRPVDNSYVFYDGPPFLTGTPHHGHLLGSTIKDVVGRYYTMQGKRVERVWGWDCHGLPAENFVEKKLGISDRREIGKSISLEDYIVTARDSMVQTSTLWEDTIDRIGRWVDFKGAYKTMDKDYMESVWWAFKQLYEKGKIYEGERVLMYDTQWATPLSKAEVTMDAGAYIEVTDPSVYVKFKLASEKPRKNIRITKDSKVLFVCFANVSRSQIAKALYNHYTKTENGEGAGVAVNDHFPDAVTYGQFESAVQASHDPSYKGRARIVLLDNHGIDIVDSLRQQLTPELIKEYDLVVNIAERGQTPDWLRGDNVVWWDIEDPHGKHGEDVIVKTYDDVEKRIKELIYGNVIDDDIDATYLLAWTTTPWTLPANTGLAINKDFHYIEVLVGGEKLIIAKELIAAVLTDEKHQPLDYEVVRSFEGKDLVGKSYEPLFENRGDLLPGEAHKIWTADYVSTESGTGIVHIAPAYGEEDFELAQKYNIPVVHVLDEYGVFTEGDWKGEDVWEINKTIAKTLLERGVVWKIDYIRHEYPHNPRTGKRLMYRAHPGWFMDIAGQRAQMLEENDKHINWFPEHIKHGRFEKTVQTAPDWNLSRDRFWATAMPVWKGTDADGKEHIKVIGSYDELKELSGVELEDYHRPWVDDITFEIDGVKYSRIDKVLDCWFESGSMPFAQFHYPFENVAKFEANFPGDFIVEYVGQVRAWFYYTHAISVGLFGHNAFKNVIVTGNMAGNDGRKMSKSIGNYTDPNILMDEYSADSLRFLMLQSPLLNGEDFTLQDKDVGDVARKLSMIWNMYDFFTMYAEVDKWEFDSDKPFGLVPADVSNPLDKWIISRLHKLNEEITKYMDEYNLPDAVSPILPFIEDASNWYVRRSRRRFWKTEDDGDKNDAYRTLHYVLLKLSVIMAPFTPFLAEELYQKMGGGNESVHLLNWPTNYIADDLVVSEMETVRDYVNQGLSLRAKSGFKVRQPLANVTVPNLGKSVDFESILTEELNVKKVIIGDVVSLNLDITPELKREGLMREVVRHIQAARKAAGLNVDDRIALGLVTHNDELQTAIDEHADVITVETLAGALSTDTYSYETTVTIEGAELTLSLQKA